MINRDYLEALVRSTEDWRERFPEEDKSAALQIAILTEELGEFAKEALRGNKANAAGEAADVLFIILKVFDMLNLDQHAMIEVAVKNDSKTRETHIVNEEGKIVRVSHTK